LTLDSASADDETVGERKCHETEAGRHTRRGGGGAGHPCRVGIRCERRGSYRWKNCTIVNKRFPHGVGKLRAHDKTSGTPVTNFRRSTVIYLRAMHYNRGLDRDKDGIACEKH
jgi:hypothetical protein